MGNKAVKLSILIRTTHDRHKMFDNLYDVLFGQAMDAEELCEIIYECDGGEMTKGEKCNLLVKRAIGEYLCFFDDDDLPSDYYIDNILAAIKGGADCSSLMGVITFDGENPEIFEHSLKYSEWKTNDGSVNPEVKYERYPNHLNAIKSSIAKQFMFPEINHGEDKEWSDAIYKSGLLKTEGYINTVIYNYIYKSIK